MIIVCNQVQCSWYCNGFCNGGIVFEIECPHLYREKILKEIYYDKSRVNSESDS